MTRLQVPLIQQETSSVCWHAAARMLAAYRQTCIDPLDAKFKANRTLMPAEFIRLARAVGLVPLPRVRQSFGAAFINDILTNHGPIWAAGYWDGLAHVIVVVGVDDSEELQINDPGWMLPRYEHMDWFNDRIAKHVAHPMMYLPPR